MTYGWALLQTLFNKEVDVFLNPYTDFRMGFVASGMDYETCQLWGPKSSLGLHIDNLLHINNVLSVAILTFNVLWVAFCFAHTLQFLSDTHLFTAHLFVSILCIGHVCCFILAAFYIWLLDWLNLGAPTAFTLHTYQHPDTHAELPTQRCWLHHKALTIS